MGESEGQLWKAWKLGEGVRKLCIKKWGASAGSGAGDLCLHAQVRSNTASDKPLDKPRVMVGKERSMGYGLEVHWKLGQPQGAWTWVRLGGSSV